MDSIHLHHDDFPKWQLPVQPIRRPSRPLAWSNAHWHTRLMIDTHRDIDSRTSGLRAPSAHSANSVLSDVRSNSTMDRYGTLVSSPCFATKFCIAVIDVSCKHVAMPRDHWVLVCVGVFVVAIATTPSKEIIYKNRNGVDQCVYYPQMENSPSMFILHPFLRLIHPYTNDKLTLSDDTAATGSGANTPMLLWVMLDLISVPRFSYPFPNAPTT